MNLTAVSVSHKTADVSFRERLAFTKKKQSEILRQILEYKYADGCVLVSTCNRTEFYLENCAPAFFEYLSEVTGIEKADLRGHMRVYTDSGATEHLFELTAGLDSMVLGEDQILGQVKDAHELALSENTSCELLNVLFRLAVTSAKKVKTETELSKTPVSVASLAVKACSEYLGGLEDKNVMVIGASGKTGAVIVKDILSVGGANLYVTTRTHLPLDNEQCDGVQFVDYAKRYEYAEKMDAVISATSSPHCVLEARLIPCSRRRIFVDLAVPKDIEADLNGKYCYINIDDFEKIAKKNNEKKLVEAKHARAIIKKYIDEFYTRRVFSEKKDVLERVYEKIASKFGEDAVKPIKYAIFKVKAVCAPNELSAYITCLERAFCGSDDNLMEGKGM